MGDSIEEDKSNISNSSLQGSKEEENDLSIADSTDIHRGNDLPGISESHNWEIVPSGGNLMPTNQSLLNRPHVGMSIKFGNIPIGFRVSGPSVWSPSAYPSSRPHVEIPIKFGNIPIGFRVSGPSVWSPSADPSNPVRPNITSQATRPRTRGAFEPQSSLAQAHQRRTPMNDTHIFSYVPTMTGSAPLTHNIVQTIFPSSREAIPLATVSTVLPTISTRARTASSAPSTSQIIPHPTRCSVCGEDFTGFFPILSCNHTICDDCQKDKSGCAICDVEDLVKDNE